MKTFIIALLIGLSGLAGQLDYTTVEVNTVVADDLAQYGASGYLSAPCTNTCTENVWEPLTNCVFTVPFVSGFSFVANSTIEYDNGLRWFAYTGGVAVENLESQIMEVEFGIMTNGVYVAGSSSGPRSLLQGQKGNLTVLSEVNITDGDQVGLCSRVTDRGGESDIGINSWNSKLSRF